MNVNGIAAITSHFTSRLSPLQFPSGGRRSVDQRLTDLESGRTGGKQATQEPAAPAAAAKPSATRPGRSRANTPKPADPDAHFNEVMARSADVLRRTAPPGARSMAASGSASSPSTGARSRAGSTPSPSAGGRSRAGMDEDTHHAQVMKRSGDILQNIRNTAAEHRAAAPLPEERHADLMRGADAALGRIRASQARLGPVDGSGSHSFYNQNEDHGWTSQVGAFRPAGKTTPDAPLRSGNVAHPVAEVKSPQQFDQSHFTTAAKAAPRPARTSTTPVVQAAPQRSAGGVGKGTQIPIKGLPKKDTFAQGKPVAPRAEQTLAPTRTGPGRGQLELFPKKSPVKNPAQFPQSSVSDSDWHSMLSESVAERKKSKKPPAPGQGSLF
jgi:hypothetical protein